MPAIQEPLPIGRRDPVAAHKEFEVDRRHQIERHDEAGQHAGVAEVRPFWEGVPGIG